MGFEPRFASCRSQTAIIDCSRSFAKNLPLATFFNALTPSWRTNLLIKVLLTNKQSMLKFLDVNE